MLSSIRVRLFCSEAHRRGGEESQWLRGEPVTVMPPSRPSTSIHKWRLRGEPVVVRPPSRPSTSIHKWQHDNELITEWVATALNTADMLTKSWIASPTFTKFKSTAMQIVDPSITFVNVAVKCANSMYKQTFHFASALPFGDSLLDDADPDPDFTSVSGEIVSLDNDEIVRLYMMTNRYTLLDDEGETPDQPEPTLLISENDMAEALLSFKKLGDLPNKIHPARALKLAEVEYKLNKLNDERVFALAEFFGCQRVNTSTIAIIKAVNGMHVTPPSHEGDRLACAALGISHRTFKVWKSTLYGEKSKQYINIKNPT